VSIDTTLTVLRIGKATVRILDFCWLWNPARHSPGAATRSGDIGQDCVRLGEGWQGNRGSKPSEEEAVKSIN